jgi:DNA-binding transcriptional ArsR family regulator
VTDSPAAPDLTPNAERVIADVETLKALSDPVRLRILETMVQAADEDWTVKRIATALGVGPTKLYHHIAILEERELIRVAGTRVVSGIIETRYRIAQLSVRLDRSLLSASVPPDEATPAIEEMLRTVFDAARDDVGRALRSGAIRLEAGHEPSPGILRQDLKRLSPARAAEFRDRLTALLDEFDFDRHDEAGGTPFGLLIALYPVTDTRIDASGADLQEPTDD